ncbi:hypothetical protein [Streptomyces sp. NPDC058371]|uniref:hypothetical protein n=1 Tax=Streptomyces sp. NPDC058371 TaxID=3346463 RepID=UPI003656C191
MTYAIARLIEPLLRLLFPARGRHRATGAPAIAPHPATRAPRRPHAVTALIRGEDTRLVRPYLVAHEQREEARRQRARRRALWLAVHGVDIGPRLIHGMEVTA